MFQLNWLLGMIPDSLLMMTINICVAVGAIMILVGLFISTLPWFNHYKVALQTVGLIVLCLALYFKGGYSSEMAWRAKIELMEEKVKTSEAKSQEVNTVIQTQVVTKTQIIKERGEDIVKYIDKEIIKYDNSCKIPDEFVNALNQAAQELK